jgi:hypothetical protein
MAIVGLASLHTSTDSWDLRKMSRSKMYSLLSVVLHMSGFRRSTRAAVVRSEYNFLVPSTCCDVDIHSAFHLSRLRLPFAEPRTSTTNESRQFRVVVTCAASASHNRVESTLFAACDD